MNISEHWTRVKAQEGRPVTVYGALIGRQVVNIIRYASNDDDDDHRHHFRPGVILNSATALNWTTM